MGDGISAPLYWEPGVKVVILNDTSIERHHGCTRVMRLLQEGLVRHGFTVSARSPVRHDWRRDAAIRAAMEDAALIVINGEGTLHHGKSAAADLLSVTDVAGDTPVALINTLYQDNPPDWSKWLNKMAYVSTRDSRSADQVEMCTGRRPFVVPDLSLSARVAPQPTIDKIIYGDSIKEEVARQLADLARSERAPLVPSVSAYKGMRNGDGFFARLRRRRMIARHLRRVKAVNPTLELCASEDAYANRVASAGLYVTGRYHGTCYAMAAGIPFVAVKSNSWKIEALIADAGLAQWRVTAAQGLLGRLARQDLAYRDHERAALDKFLDDAAASAEAMFSNLRALV